jgi:hypothetical protein
MGKMSRADHEKQDKEEVRSVFQMDRPGLWPSGALGSGEPDLLAGRHRDDHLATRVYRRRSVP